MENVILTSANIEALASSRESPDFKPITQSSIEAKATILLICAFLSYLTLYYSNIMAGSRLQFCLGAALLFGAIAIIVRVVQSSAILLAIPGSIIGGLALGAFISTIDHEWLANANFDIGIYVLCALLFVTALTAFRLPYSGWPFVLYIAIAFFYQCFYYITFDSSLIIDSLIYVFKAFVFVTLGCLLAVLAGYNIINGHRQRIHEAKKQNVPQKYEWFLAISLLIELSFYPLYMLCIWMSSRLTEESPES